MSGWTSPFLGPPRDDETWTCGFMTVPGTRNCDRPAEYHGLIFEFVDEQPELKDMAYSCSEHLEAMQLSSQLEHELGSACGLPGSQCEWDNGLSWCWMPDLSAELRGIGTQSVTA